MAGQYDVIKWKNGGVFRLVNKMQVAKGSAVIGWEEVYLIGE